VLPLQNLASLAEEKAQSRLRRMNGAPNIRGNKSLIRELKPVSKLSYQNNQNKKQGLCIKTLLLYFN